MNMSGKPTAHLARCFLGLVLLMLCSFVHGQDVQDNAQPGVNCIPVQNPDFSGCVPIDNSQNNRSQPRYEDQWGAVAVDSVSAVMKAGAGFERPTREEAEQAAIENCQSNGGLHCKIELAYYNQCVAMSVGDHYFHVSSAATTDQASKYSLESCNQAATNCRVIYTSCSLPKRIQ